MSLRTWKGSYLPLTVGSLAAFGLATTVLFWRNKDRKRRKKIKELVKLSDDATTGTDLSEKALKWAFGEAASAMSRLDSRKITQGDKLLLYGLFKQATVGDRDSSGDPVPSKFNVVAYAKYTAWGKFQGLSRTAAMVNYVEVAQHFVNGGDGHENDDIIYPDEDDDEDDDGISGGFGMRPSTMKYGPEGGEEEVDASSMDPQHKLWSACCVSLSVEDMKEALELGAQVQGADEHGETALHFCADKGFYEGVKFLAEECGSDVNAVDLEEISVLQAAVIGGCIETVALLLEAGADPDHTDIDGDSPRSCAEDGTEAMQLLFKKI